jgi:threonine dehydrogenase-like Zn-dependent dehydrogenase
VSSRTQATAAVNPKAECTELQELPLPELGAFAGLLEVEACGVCGTDWEFYRRKRGAQLGPLILGHETVGRIVELGEGASERWGVRLGDRVAVEEFLPCGVCLRCRRGDYRFCAATDSQSEGPFRRYGATPLEIPPGLWGGFSTHLYLDPRAVVYPLPPGVDAELATLFVPIANGIHWVVLEAGGHVGESLLVIGPGQHGLACVAAGRSAGMGPIVVAGLSADRSRLAAARELGAHRTIDVDREELLPAVREILPDGADVVVDVTPEARESVAQAVEAAAFRGRVVLAGGHRGSVEIDHDLVVRKGLTVRGVRGHDTRSVVPALGLIAAHRETLSLLCTDRAPLERTDAALRLFGERTDPDSIHISVVPE